MFCDLLCCCVFGKSWFFACGTICENHWFCLCFGVVFRIFKITISWKSMFCDSLFEYFSGGWGEGESWCGKLRFDEWSYNLKPICIEWVWSTMGSAQVLLNSRMRGQSQLSPPRENCALLSPATSTGDCRFSAEVMQAPVRRLLRAHLNDKDMQT